MKIYKAIKKDHEIQRNLLDKIKNKSQNIEDRKSVWLDLKKELEVHAVAEERYFYSPLIKTDEMQEDARHGIAEHHEMDELIEELDNIDMNSPKWMSTCEELSETVLHHLDDEEKKFFDKAQEIYDEQEERKLADKYIATMEEYRSRWPESIPGHDKEIED